MRNATDCRTAGTFAYRGHSGENRIRFSGKVGHRRLAPGKYTISPIRVRGSSPARRSSVGVVVLRRGSVPGKVTENCRSRAAGVVTSSGSKPGASPGRTQPKKKEGGILGAVKRALTPPHLSLPHIPRPPLSALTSPDGLPWVLGLAALLVLLLSGGAILAYVANFVRRSDA